MNIHRDCMLHLTSRYQSLNYLIITCTSYTISLFKSIEFIAVFISKINCVILSLLFIYIHLMTTFNTFCNQYRSRHAGLFLLRLAVGIIFIYEACFKFTHLPMMLAFFAHIGLSAFFVYFVAIVELLGGISLVIGLFTRFFSIALVIDMIFALILVTAKISNPSGQVHWLILASLITIFVSGCGKYSVCALSHGKSCAECKKNGRCECQHGTM